VSPIFVRPVREQLEHDRLIRHLQAKYKKKFEVAVNMGEEQSAPVKIGPKNFFPDLVLTADRKLAGVVEVETGESVNNLEAMAQWVHFARARVPFHLYVPVSGYDAARRLCDANQARVTEIWTYRPAADGFDLVRSHVDAAAATARTPATKVLVPKAPVTGPVPKTPVAKTPAPKVPAARAVPEAAPAKPVKAAKPKAAAARPLPAKAVKTAPRATAAKRPAARTKRK
jgi:hypothetical protein